MLLEEFELEENDFGFWFLFFMNMQIWRRVFKRILMNTSAARIWKLRFEPQMWSKVFARKGLFQQTQIQETH